MTATSPLRELPDANLCLAVVSRLMELGTVPRFEVPAPDGFEYRQDVADALLDLPVTAEQCATLRELMWHMSSSAISMIWREWGGECEEFDVRSLDGISTVLPALESLHLELTGVTDLTPLTRCDRLGALTLAGGYDDETGLEPLSRVESLRTLTLRSKCVEDLSPLAVLPLEHLTLDGCHDSGSHDVIDLAPLEHIPSLRTVNYRRFARVRGDEHPVLTAFDNARVVRSLGERGVALAFEW